MTARVVERLQEFILDNFLFGDESRIPAEDASLLGNGVIDSTGVLELIEFLEEAFGVQVEDSETIPGNLDSLGGLKRYLELKLGQLEGAA